MLLMAAVALVGVGLALAARASRDDSEDQPVDRHEQGSRAASAGVTSATVTSVPARLGRSAQGDGMTVTVLAYEQPVRSDVYLPSPAQEYAVMQVSMCATAPTVTNTVFTAVMADGSRHKSVLAEFDGYQPHLHAFAALAPGDCLRGWVTLSVPIGQRPVHVIEEGSGARIDL